MRILRTLLVCLPWASSERRRRPRQVTIKLIAINDFHGYIEPSETCAARSRRSAKTVRRTGSAVRPIWPPRSPDSRPNRRNVVVGAGDMVGRARSTPRSFHDDPRSKH